jgi:hypothetical protein
MVTRATSRFTTPGERGRCLKTTVNFCLSRNFGGAPTAEGHRERFGE